MDPKRATILLIEDDRILADMYRLKFEVSGLGLLVAFGGYEGLDSAKKAKPDLILLDLRMDDLDGFEVLTRLKADPTLAHIPVILLTNMSEKDNAEKGLALGAEAYVLKSKILPDALVARVTARLAQVSPRE